VTSVSNSAQRGLESLTHPVGLVPVAAASQVWQKFSANGIASSRWGWVEGDQEQQAEVVAQPRIDGVVVDEVAKAIQDVILHALEHAGRVPRYQGGAGAAKLIGGPPDIRPGSREHV
jgi:hypothetical protein